MNKPIKEIQAREIPNRKRRNAFIPRPGVMGERGNCVLASSLHQFGFCKTAAVIQRVYTRETNSTRAAGVQRKQKLQNTKETKNIETRNNIMFLNSRRKQKTRQCGSHFVHLLVLSSFLLLSMDRTVAFCPPAVSNTIRSWNGIPCLAHNNNKRNNNKLNVQETNILEMEKEVFGSARAKLDRKRVVQALDNVDTTKTPKTKALIADDFQISMAAALTASCGVFVATDHNEFFSMIVFVGVFFAAFGDPIEQEGILGPGSRLLGRATIQTVESSRPRLQRIARAAIIDDDDDDEDNQVSKLDRPTTIKDPSVVSYIEQLEEENKRLRAWKDQRLLVDHYQVYYSMPDLEAQARRNSIPIKEGTTKAQLLMQLVKMDIITLQ